MADDRDGLTGFHAKADVPQDPILALICKPHVIELDRPGKFGDGTRVARAEDCGLGIEQLKNTLRRSHGGLQDVVLFAEILDRPEEPLPPLQEGNHHAQREPARTNLEPAVAQDAGERQHGEELHHGVEPAISGDRVLEGEHVVAVDLFELIGATLLPVE